MAILLMEGFDLYDSDVDLEASAFWSRAGAAGFSTTGGRGGKGALFLNSTGTTTDWQLSTPTAHAINVNRYYSFSIKFEALPSISGNGVYILCLLESGGRRTCGLTVTTAGVLNLVGASTSPFTVPDGVYPTSFSFVPGQWYRVELKAKMTTGNSTGQGIAEVRVDGNTVLSASGLDFYSSGTVIDMGANILFQTPANTSGYLIDDFVINDENGTANNSFLGDVIIDTLRPDGAGTEQDWLANTGTAVGAIDDPLGASDGDTTYIASSTIGDKSEFTLSDLPDASAAILAVQPRVKAKKTDAGDRGYRSYMLSNGNVANGPAIVLPLDYAAPSGGIFETNPDGSVAWTDATVNALQAGVETVS